MDPRRLLILAALGLALSGCASVRESLGFGRAPPQAAPVLASVGPPASSTLPPPQHLVARSSTERPYLAEVAGIAPASLPSEAGAAPEGPTEPVPETAPPEPARRTARAPAVTGPTAIAAANTEARARSQSDQFVGGVQVFAWEPGRVYEVWTAPLRVTTLTLAPGETVVSKAAGDTVRWQIGETTSGEGRSQRGHVMIKPLERGLETNLVLTTSRRVYLLQLKSGAPEGFNAAVAWDLASVFPNGSDGSVGAMQTEPDSLVEPAGPLDARYRIESRGRRPNWTPASVVTDGVRTFLHFPPDLQATEAPALFVLGPDGQTQTVNYRQQGGLWVVDRVFDRAELRLGDRRPQIVRITRLQP
jgi:type IV secretion system protein TrbG